MKNYFGKLMELAVKYNSDDFHVFVWFSGHVDEIKLRIHCGGWKRDKNPNFTKDFYTTDPSDTTDAFNACRVLLKMYRQWKKNKTIWEPDF